MFESRAEAVEHLHQTTRGIVHDRFERDTRTLFDAADIRKKRRRESKRVERERSLFLDAMDDLENEILHLVANVIAHTRNQAWDSRTMVQLFADASYEARDYVVRSLFPKVFTAYFKHTIESGISSSGELARLRKASETIMSQPAATKYPVIARDPTTGSLCQRDTSESTTYADPVVIEDEATQSLGPPVAGDYDDIVGKKVYMFYPSYGYYWGVVSGPDQTKPGNVLIYHEDDNIERSRPAQVVRNRIQRFGSEPDRYRGAQHLAQNLVSYVTTTTG